MDVLTVKDVQEKLKIGRDTAYKLMSTEGFPSYRIGKKIYVTKEALEKWLREAENKEFKI